MKILSLLQIILLYLGILVTVECHLGDEIAKLVQKSKNPIERDEHGQLVEHCGEANYSFSASENGGGTTHAAPNEFPWVVAIQYLFQDEWTHLCHGSIIHARFILTSAHCVCFIPEEELRIAAGLHNYWERTGTTQYRNLSNIHIGYRYNTTYWQRHRFNESYDVAVLELTDPLEIQRGIVAPICIPTGKDDDFSDEAAAAGWEVTPQIDIIDPIMQKTQMGIVDFNICHVTWSEENYDNLLFYDFVELCLTTPNYKTACEGDFDGGSVMCKDKKSNKTIACGLIKYGAGCAVDGLPGIATNTSCCLDWIEDDMNLSNNTYFLNNWGQ